MCRTYQFYTVCRNLEIVTAAAAGFCFDAISSYLDSFSSYDEISSNCVPDYDDSNVEWGQICKYSVVQSAMFRVLTIEAEGLDRKPIRPAELTKTQIV